MTWPPWLLIFFLVMHEVDKVMIDDDTLWYFEVERWPLLSALKICKQDDLIDMLVGELEEPNTQSSLPRKERIAPWMPCSWRLPLQLPCSLVIARGKWKECLCERIFIWCNNRQSVWWIKHTSKCTLSRSLSMHLTTPRVQMSWRWTNLLKALTSLEVHLKDHVASLVSFDILLQPSLAS